MEEARLAGLCAALRRAGLAVGVHEEVCLRHVLGGALPEGEALRPLLAAVVVKSREARPVFDAAFDAWLAAQEQAPARLPVAVPGGQGRGPWWRRVPWQWVAAGIGVLAVVAGGIWVGRRVLASWARQGPPVGVAQKGGGGGGGTAGAEVSSPYRVPVPRIRWSLPPEVTPRRDYGGAAAAGIGLLSLGGLWVLLRRRSYLPQVRPIEVDLSSGPSRPRLPLPAGGAPRLLGRGDEELVVHGVGRYVSAEATRRLDMRATVRATARAGGLPALRFQAARHQREVWLWYDRAIGALGQGGGEAARLREEVAGLLRKAGLPLEQASFWGVPERLERAEGGWFAPGEVDDRRDNALVVLLTDGRGLGRALGDAGLARQVGALLRQLAGWPGLVMVDCGAGQLSGLVAPWGLPVCTPRELAAHLGGVERGRGGEGDEAVCGEARAWLAACALSPRALSEGEALALGRGVGLRVSGWDLGRLPFAGGRLVLGQGDRAALLGWLRRSEPGLLRRAAVWLAGWYEEAGKGVQAGSAEALGLEVDRLLLGLWWEVDEGVEKLYRIWGGGYKGPIEAALGGMGPLELEGEEGRVILPFWLRERGPAAQLMLREMGLSRGARWQRAVRSLRRPGRAYLGLGLCLGLLGVGAAMQGVRWRVGVKGVAGAPRVEQVGAPEFPMEKVEDLGGGKWAVSARGQGRVEVPAGAVVRIEWGTEEREECPKLTAKGKDGMEFVRVCGGTFMMGSGEEDKAAFDWEKPRYRVTLGEYWIGKYEVTVGQYGGEGDASLPVNRVDWHQARKFCQDHGYRLPTEEEWEFAARGREGRIYPWGNKFDSKLVVDTLRPVAEKPEGAGPFGAMHQAGNVWEWVEDCYHSDDYTQRLKRTQEGDKKVDKPDMAGNKLTVDTCWYRVLRGGSFIVEPRFLRSAYRFWDLPEGRFVSVGFRCARGVAPSN